MFFIILCVLSGVLASVLTLWNPTIPDWIKGLALLDDIPDDVQDDVRRFVIPIETNSKFLISFWIISRWLIISSNVWIFWATLNIVLGLCLWIAVEVPRNFYNLFTHILPIPFIDKPKSLDHAMDNVIYRGKVQIILLIISMFLLLLHATTFIEFGTLSLPFGCFLWVI